MCGLTGFLSPFGFDEAFAAKTVSGMTDSLYHRGPDDLGIWVDAYRGIALGHRRLSINDLSTAGHQPMVSASGRYVIVFNGEIYNHLALRRLLPEQAWRGHSDTETLLAAIEQWGLQKTLQTSVGMFAIALWDRKQGVVLLARDRMGEKPLYYGWQGKSFIFGSELKALKKHPDFQSVIDRDVLSLYVRRGYVPAPYSMFSGVFKLQPGTIAVLRGDSEPGVKPQISHYWSIEEVIQRKVTDPFRGDLNEAVTQLELHLLDAIAGQSVADVPLGAFLSGGIDSTSVVALMQVYGRKPVRTFSIGFEEQGYDESIHARNIAGYLGTEHTEFRLTASDALKVIPDLSKIYDEPFADSSQIPTILVSRLARKHVTVAITGDGGDELFCGYGRYSQIAARWKNLSRIPYFARHIASHLLPASPLQEGIGAPNLDSFYKFMNWQWKGRPSLVREVRGAETEVVIPLKLTSAYERMMYADLLSYLPDDILVKVDRAAMSCGLETRVPLLDHRVIEFAWSLPSNLKLYNGVTKWPLKQLLYRHVPQELVDRPKMGFAVPIDQWLRKELRDWAEGLLDESSMNQQGYFNSKLIRKEWDKHLSGKSNRHYGLWTILMFQAWLEH